MASLESPDSNILDADAVNWRLVVYPILGVLILLVGGCGIYFYLQNARAQHEADARQAYLAAKTPDALLQMADQFPGTTHAAMALISAGNTAYDQKDYATAQKDYQRVVDISGIDVSMRDSARLGLASALEAAGNSDSQAVDAYLAVGQRGKDSPFSSYAYLAAAHICARQHNTDKEKQYLVAAAGIDTQSAFSQQAQRLLQSLNGAAPGLPSTP
jgi:predicted negative regulator of RcsB-dependent stress response